MIVRGPWFQEPDHVNPRFFRIKDRDGRDVARVYHQADVLAIEALPRMVQALKRATNGKLPELEARNILDSIGEEWP